MRRSIRSLNAGCKSLKFILEEILGPGPDLHEAKSLLRSLYHTAKDAILADEDAFDREAKALIAAQEQALGDRLFFDNDNSPVTPTVRGTFVTVLQIERLLDDGWDYAEILSTHPELDRDDIEACLNFIEFSKTYQIHGEQIAA